MVRNWMCAAAVLAAAAVCAAAYETASAPSRRLAVHSMVPWRAGLVGEADGRLVVLDATSPPHPAPVPGRIMDVAGDGRRLWILRAQGDGCEIDEVGDNWALRRRAVCRFAAAELAVGGGRLWAGSFTEADGITVQAFAEDGTPGPRWNVPLRVPPLDSVEEAVLARMAGPPEVVLCGYELVALDDGAVLIFRRRNMLVTLPASGGAPHAVRWQALGRRILEAALNGRKPAHPFPLAAIPMVSQALGLGTRGLLVVEPWSESYVTAVERYLRTGVDQRLTSRASVTWLTARGVVRKRWPLTWRPAALALRNGALVGVDRDGRIRPIPINLK